MLFRISTQYPRFREMSVYIGGWRFFNNERKLQMEAVQEGFVTLA